MEGSFESFAVNGRLVEAPPAAGATLALAALAGAGLAAPLLKQGAARLAGVLYARIPASDVLGSGPRRRIYELVLAEPGISLSELASKSGLSWGATVHHLGVLRRSGLVSSLRHGRHRRWFAPGACDQVERVQVAQLRNPVSARVARLVLEQPGLSQKQLAELVGMSPQAVHWHLVRLHGAGLVDRVRDGREVRHFVRAAPGPSLSAAGAAPALPPALP
jgi:predicted transcriptional regulator